LPTRSESSIGFEVLALSDACLNKLLIYISRYWRYWL